MRNDTSHGNVTVTCGGTVPSPTERSPIGSRRAMSTLFASLHHVSAFTLVSALAIEFALIRQELTLASARRLQVTDMVLGIAAGALLMIGLLRVFFFEKGAA